MLVYYTVDNSIASGLRGAIGVDPLVGDEIPVRRKVDAVGLDEVKQVLTRLCGRVRVELLQEVHEWLEERFSAVVGRCGSGFRDHLDDRLCE